jgi:hypothetical protein
MKIQHGISPGFANCGSNGVSILLIFFTIFLELFLSTLPLEAQDGRRTMNTSICAIASHPERLDGMIVRVKARVGVGMEVFRITDPRSKCKNSFWLSYPDEAYPVLPEPSIKRIPVELRKDEQFELFEKYLDAKMYPRFEEAYCYCKRYEVIATLTGRVDVASNVQRGFGHLSGWKVQFVLQTVTDITPMDISTRYDPKEYSTEPVEPQPKQWRKPSSNSP